MSRVNENPYSTPCIYSSAIVTGIILFIFSPLVFGTRYNTETTTTVITTKTKHINNNNNNTETFVIRVHGLCIIVSGTWGADCRPILIVLARRDLARSSSVFYFYFRRFKTTVVDLTRRRGRVIKIFTP